MSQKLISVNLMKVVVEFEAPTSKSSVGIDESSYSPDEWMSEEVFLAVLQTFQELYPSSTCYIVSQNNSQVFVEVIGTERLNPAPIYQCGLSNLNTASQSKGLEEIASAFILTALTKTAMTLQEYNRRNAEASAKAPYIMESALKEIKTEVPSTEPSSNSSISIRRGHYRVKAEGTAANFLAVGECISNIVDSGSKLISPFPASLWLALKQAFDRIKLVITAASSGSLLLELFCEDEASCRKALEALLFGRVLEQVNDASPNSGVKFDSMTLVMFEYVLMDEIQWRGKIDEAKKLFQKFSCDVETGQHTQAFMDENYEKKVIKTDTTLRKRKGCEQENLLDEPQPKRHDQNSIPFLEKLFKETDTYKTRKEEDVDLYEALAEKYEIGRDLRDAQFMLKYYSVLLKTRRYQEANELTKEMLTLFQKNLADVAPQNVKHLADSKFFQGYHYESILFYYISAQLKDATAEDCKLSLEATGTVVTKMMQKKTRLENFVKRFVVPLMQVNVKKLSGMPAEDPVKKCLLVVAAKVVIAEVQATLDDQSESDTIMQAISHAEEILGKNAQLYKVFGKCHEILGMMYLRGGEAYKDLRKASFKRAKECYGSATDFPSEAERSTYVEKRTLFMNRGRSSHFVFPTYRDSFELSSIRSLPFPFDVEDDDNDV